MRALATDRLDLKPCDVSDADVLWRLWIDPDVRRHLWDDQVIPVDRARALVAESAEAARTSGTGLWTVRRRGDAEIVGFCGLRPTEDGEVEVIYGLAPACWGHGLATEATRAVLQYAFDELGLARVVAATDPPNTASVRVLERLSMEPRTGEPGLASHLVHFQLGSTRGRATGGAAGSGDAPGPLRHPPPGQPPARRSVMSATSTLAAFVAGNRLEDCPAGAVEAARRAILDGLGVMLAGSAEPAAHIVRRVAEAEGGGPLCTLVGTGLRSGALWAALFNGTAAHALDFDDTNFAMLGHPSAPVLSAALAAGELATATGGDVVHAFLLGFEVETTLAEVVNPDHYEHGWHATCTLGTLGAAAAAARLLALDADGTATALAVAASQSSGLKENFGTMTKPFHAGHAARSGVLAALLAREGWTASARALEGPQGFVNVLGAGGRRLEALDTLGAPWKILTTGVAVKPYPSCACTHSIIDSALELRRRHAVVAEAVEEVVVGVNERVPRILIHSDPRTGLEAKFSAEFCAAAALAEPRVGIETFRDDRIGDPTLRGLMKRVRVVVDPEIPGDLERHMWTRLTVRLIDGRQLEVAPRPVPGHPSHPLSAEALREKFESCAAVALSPDRLSVVREMIESLDGCPDLRSLTALLGP